MLPFPSPCQPLATECSTLGKLSYQDKDYYHCSLWMDVALAIDKADGFKTLDRSEALDYSSYSKAVVSVKWDFMIKKQINNA